MKVKIIRRRAVAAVIVEDVVLVVVVMVQPYAGGRHFEDGVVEFGEVAVDALGVAEVERGHVDGGRDGGVSRLRDDVAVVGRLVTRSRNGLELVQDVSEGNSAVLGPEFEIVEAVKVPIVVVSVGNVDGHDSVAIAAVDFATVFVVVVHGDCRPRTG